MLVGVLGCLLCLLWLLYFGWRLLLWTLVCGLGGLFVCLLVNVLAVGGLWVGFCFVVCLLLGLLSVYLCGAIVVVLLVSWDWLVAGMVFCLWCFGRLVVFCVLYVDSFCVGVCELVAAMVNSLIACGLVLFWVVGLCTILVICVWFWWFGLDC